MLSLRIQMIQIWFLSSATTSEAFFGSISITKSVYIKCKYLMLAWYLKLWIEVLYNLDIAHYISAYLLVPKLYIIEMVL